MRIVSHCRRWTTRALQTLVMLGLASALTLFGQYHLQIAAADGSATISGTVHNADGDPVAGVRVGIFALGQLFVATNSSGAYTIAGVPKSTSPFDIQLLAPCTRDQSTRVVVNGNKTVNFTIPTADTQSGYTCSTSTFPYIDGTSVLPLAGDDAMLNTGLPFTFAFFGTSYTSANVDTNGFVSFGATGASQFFNTALPTTTSPKPAIFGFWDDLFVDATAAVRTTSGGVTPNRFVVYEWSNATTLSDPGVRFDFEIVLFENGRIVLNYKNLADATGFARERGDSATVGIQNAGGTAAFQRSYNQPYLESGYGIEFVPKSK